MDGQSKRDVTAAVLIGLMFLGAFVLPSTGFGFVLIGLGGAGMLVMLMLAALDRS